MKNRSKHIVGIDEAGRGPLAGPVAVGAIMADKKHLRFLRGIKDSKKLREKAREEWFFKIKTLSEKNIFRWSVVLVSEKIIDKKGISFAIRTGIHASLTKLKVGENTEILLDGALKAPPEYKYQKTIIRGDEKKPVISAASIMAKVVRDRHMKKISKIHPNYAFDKHKGYGTKEHYRRIKKHGLSKIHRRSFLKKVKL